MSYISGYEAVYRTPKNPKNANLQNEPNPIFEHSGPPIPSGLPRNLKSAKPEAFQTMDEIRAYVSGNRIQCLVCGKYFRRLQYLHLLRHDMTSDDYREAFGIPWNTSLTSATSREATASKMTPERIELFKQCRKVRGTTRRQNAPAVRNQWRRNAVLGRYLVYEMVTAPCATCGAPVQTTALCAVQPIHCDKCASPASMRVRAYYRRKQAKLAA
jgi:hypothetical protein